MKVTFIFLLFLITIPFSTVHARDASEQDIKAVYLYNFLRFITWPKSKKHENTATICILGNENYLDAFKSVENKPLKSDQRILIIDRINTFLTIDSLSHCHLLFITGSEFYQTPSILHLITHKDMLLVGETSGFIEAGGMMEFHRVGNKIRWKINLTATNLAGFKIDRRLLQSATQVIQKPMSDKSTNTEIPLPLISKDTITSDPYIRGYKQ